MVDPHDDAVGTTRPGHYGASGSGVALAVATIAAAWNVQGDPSSAAFVNQVRRLFDIALPLAPCTTTRTDALAALWLGPTSWLLIAGGASPLIDYATKRNALNEAGGALFDVTAGRVAWTLSGHHAADVLAKGCPLDFHPGAFAAGSCAQSLYGHVNVLIDRRDASTFTLLVAQNLARDTWHALCGASAQYGFDVMSPAAFR